MKAGRWLLLLILVAVIAAIYAFDLQRFLDFHYIKGQQEQLEAWHQMHPIGTVLLFFGLYLLLAVLPIGGAVILTVVAGAILGPLWGSLVASFAAAASACFGFLIGRYLLRGLLQQRYAAQLQRVDDGIARDGLMYLFTVRMVPVLPFFLVNFIFGVSSMRLRSFWWISQLAMLPGAVIYVNAGTQLAHLDTLKGIMTPKMLLTFALVALLPWIGRVIANGVKRRRGAANPA